MIITAGTPIPTIVDYLLSLPPNEQPLRIQMLLRRQRTQVVAQLTNEINERQELRNKLFLEI